MTLPGAIALIRNDEVGLKTGAQWADLGCGSGLFTYALASLLQKQSFIHAIDKSPVALQQLPNPNDVTIYTKQLDFLHHALPADKLDGILMANSLHFVSNKLHFIGTVEKQLNDEGVFLLVEYDTDKPNPWVPHPVSCSSLQTLFSTAGYPFFRKLNEIPSLYHSGNIYAALIKK